MNIYLTGASGFIGKGLVKAGCKPLICDVREYNDVDRAVTQAKPDIVIHLAGISEPDYCELHSDESSKINVRGTYYVMEVCTRLGVPAVYLSSSQIWGGGTWESLWNKHSEDSKLTPSVNNYGMQKIAAESFVQSFDQYVIRTSYVFNRERFSTELNWLKHGIFVDAPTFLKRSFIHMDDFIFLVSEYCKRIKNMPKLLHIAGSEEVSYSTFWKEVCSQFGYNPKLVKSRRVERDIYPARRPHNGGLDISLSQKLGFDTFDYIGGIRRMKDES